MPFLISCSSSIHGFETMTNISFPGSTRAIQVFDNSEFYMVGKMRIENSGDIPRFIARNGLVKLSGQDGKTLSFDNVLKKENRVVFNGSEFYHGAGRTGSNRWNILLNKRTGEVWIEVLYPDHSGDNP